MAKIPQKQFVKVIESIEEDRNKHEGLTSSGDNFGKSWYLSGAYGIQNSKGLADRYTLSHYGTRVLEVWVDADKSTRVTHLEVHSASDRDCINSLLRLLGSKYKTNIHGDLLDRV